GPSKRQWNQRKPKAGKLTMVPIGASQFIFTVIALVVGFGLGNWWVRSRYVVLSRNTHIAFLRTLRSRTRALDRLRRMRPVPVLQTNRTEHRHRINLALHTKGDHP